MFEVGSRVGSQSRTVMAETSTAANPAAILNKLALVLVNSLGAGVSTMYAYLLVVTAVLNSNDSLQQPGVLEGEAARAYARVLIDGFLANYRSLPHYKVTYRLRVGKCVAPDMEKARDVGPTEEISEAEVYLAVDGEQRAYQLRTVELKTTLVVENGKRTTSAPFLTKPLCPIRPIRCTDRGPSIFREKVPDYPSRVQCIHRGQ